MADSKRTRQWLFVMYPDSMPENAFEIIKNFHIQAVISPLHDADINGDGSEKKAHYHVLLYFDGVKSYDQVLELIKPLNTPLPLRCNSIKGSLRYFIHLDNPEKAQYKFEDMTLLNGFDIESYLMPTKSEIEDIWKEIYFWISDTGCDEYSLLMEEARLYHFETWFYVLTTYSSAHVVWTMRSMQHRNELGSSSSSRNRKYVNPNTGEVIYD